MKQDELLKAIKYASDPSTDRTFLAFKFLEAMLVKTIPNSPGDIVAIAFKLADDFIRQQKPKDSK